MTLSTKPGNPLGAVRAESDKEMLEKAFFETSEYRSLTQTQDFHFIVGRRGTGKSALFLKTEEYHKKQPKTIIITQTPQESAMIALKELLVSLGILDYRKARAITRVLWKIYIYFAVMPSLIQNYKFKSAQKSSILLNLRNEHKSILDNLSCAAILRHALKSPSQDESLLERLAKRFSLKELEDSIREVLENSGHRCIVMFDGLDEGWEPNAISTSVVGGLAITVADIADSQIGIHTMLFVRDNMFRALASLDEDASRHIEGATLRLHWEARSLFILVVKRLRVTFDWTDVEADAKVWNRFAQRELTGFEGFKKCLLNTLYRPRDVLVLLNASYQLASKEQRGAIIEDDIDAAARRVSHNRLDDLHKEYDRIFPGISQFTSIFREKPAIESFGKVAVLLQQHRDKVSFDSSEQRDFAILDSGKNILYALYSVGFVGVFDVTNQSYTFCHDGASADLDAIPDSQSTMIHPCYWRALDIQHEDYGENIINQINDEYEQKVNQLDLKDSKDIRTQRIGTIIGELNQIPHKEAGQQHFSQWVLQIVQILFSGALASPRIDESLSATKRAVLSAKNIAAAGFWKKVNDKYHSQIVLFDIVNNAELTSEEFAQITKRTMDIAGNFSVLIIRSENESINASDAEHIRYLYTRNNHLLMAIPSCALCKAVRKMRNPEKMNYTEEFLKKRIVHIYRQVLGEKTWYW